MSARTKPTPAAAPAAEIRVPIATLTEYAAGRPRAVSLVVGAHGVHVEMEEISGSVPLLDGTLFQTPSLAAEALYDRYPPTQLWLEPLGVDYLSALSERRPQPPAVLPWIIQHTGGYPLLSMAQLTVIVWTGTGAREQSRLVREWLALALPRVPVRRRPAGGMDWEVVIGVLG